MVSHHRMRGDENALGRRGFGDEAGHEPGREHGKQNGLHQKIVTVSTTVLV
ncbi:MAG: hypothetical protein R2882_06680 [Gemmatimonadales bacterium]